MSAEGFNLSEFSQYLDDTDGHRLAQFLQKKSAAVRAGGRRIFDCEPERFSLNVQLKRLSSPLLPPLTKNVENQKTRTNEGNVIQLQVKEVPINILASGAVIVETHANSQTDAVGVVGSDDSLEMALNNSKQCQENANNLINQEILSSPSMPSTQEERSEIQRKTPPNTQNNWELNQPQQIEPKSIGPEQNSHQLLQDNEDVNKGCRRPLPPSTLQISPGRPGGSLSHASPKTKLLRSGGVSSADRLRRQVLKRVTNIGNNGRRTLLKEFESTIASSDFSPQICSTPMQQQSRESMPKTLPHLEVSPTSSRTNENSGNIANDDLLQLTENNDINVGNQPLIRNMVETLEETIKKLKSFENSHVTVAAAAESSKSAVMVHNTQDLLMQARVQTLSRNEITQSNVPATQELLQEVQNALHDLRKSQLQTPKIVIPVNQTFNNVPSPTTKETSCNEPIKEKDDSKITVTEIDRTVTAGVVQGTPRIYENIAENIENCGSYHNVVNHATFTRITTPDETSKELTIDQTLKNRLSYSQKAQLTFSKHDSTPSEKMTNKTVSDPSSKYLTRKSVSMKAHETNVTANSLKAASKRNISCVNTVYANVEMNEDQPTVSALGKFNKNFEVTCNKTQRTNVSKRSLSLVSKRYILKDEHAQAERREITHNDSIAAAADNFNNSIITEDEDEQYETINKKQTLRKCGPLNLASDKPKLTKRSRRTIRRTAKSRRSTAISIITSDTEADSGPPPAHPLNLHYIQQVENKRMSRLKRPLNKPPSTPKNGELFADELKMQLARLTNHEILDLRKRNSMGLLAPTRLRKSIICTRINDQLRIEDEIQLEILRRELIGSSEGLRDEEKDNEDRVIEDEMIFNELPAAPDEFRDNATATIKDATMRERLGHLTSRLIYNSSLIDDNSTEHVSFRSPATNNNTTQVRRLRTCRKAEQVPEVTKKYMELHKNLKKRRKSKGTKRSLYSKGLSDSESDERADKSANSSITAIEPIPPPPIVSPLKDWHIASPPPPFRVSPTFSDGPLSTPPPPPSPFRVTPTLSNEALPTPPQPISPPRPFVNDCTNYIENTSARHVSSAKRKNSHLTQAGCQTDNDDIFKKPTMPPPRAASKRKIHTKAPPQKPPAVTAIANYANNTQNMNDTNSLRRSKRGQVPRKLSSIFESLLNGVKHSKSMQMLNKKQPSIKNGTNVDMSAPDASSTVNGADRKSKARSRFSRMPKFTSPAPSYLGDTNTTSGTVYSERNLYYSRLGVIEETETESEGYAADVERAVNLPQMTSDSEAPSNNKKSAQPKRKKGRPKKSTKLTSVRVQKEKRKQAKAKSAVGIPENASSEPVNHLDNELTTNRTGQLEYSRVNLPPPPSLEKLNEMFDELKNAANDSSDGASSTSTTNTEAASSSSTAANLTNRRTRKLRVRLQRVEVTDATPTTSSWSSACTSTQTQSSSRNELLTWLKNVTHLQYATNNDEVFKDMQPSAAGKLYFTDLEGIDYAFYDTKDKCSLGYLRFKPLQSKPSKRAKKYHLHFVVLAGTFEIGTDREKGTFCVGDMVAINIGCRYKITNLDNDIGIIMVFKK